MSINSLLCSCIELVVGFLLLLCTFNIFNKFPVTNYTNLSLSYQLHAACPAVIFFLVVISLSSCQKFVPSGSLLQSFHP